MLMLRAVSVGVSGLAKLVISKVKKIDFFVFLQLLIDKEKESGKNNNIQKYSFYFELLQRFFSLS